MMLPQSIIEDLVGYYVQGGVKDAFSSSAAVEPLGKRRVSYVLADVVARSGRAVEVHITGRPELVQEQIEVLGQPFVDQALGELYSPGQTVALLARRRVKVVFQDAAARFARKIESIV